ncbi:MAG TPA: hypothetical protein VJ783_21275 [Pirellulales bacterium]|nr:hypothetical protein [Pirellulales bacterium]
MRKILFILLVSTMALAGCRNQSPAKSDKAQPATSDGSTVVKTIPIVGFDPDGEPEIRVMSDGALMVVFEFMPPSYAEDEEAKFADFEKQLEWAVRVPVSREDREFFLIQHPESDTPEKVKSFLEGFSNVESTN